MQIIKDAGMRGLTNALKIVAGLAVGFLLVHWFTGGQQAIIQQNQPPQAAPKYDPLNDPTSPQYVLHQHRTECWTGDEKPKAELPGAAIVQWTKNGMVQYTTVHWKADAAFNEALANIGYGSKTSDKLDPIALCVGP